MALISCVDCHERVSTDAERCPKCGAKVLTEAESNKRLATSLVLKTKAVLVLAVLGGTIWAVQTYRGRVETNGSAVTTADCRQDLKILDASIERLIEIGKVSAKMHYANSQVNSLIGAESLSINKKEFIGDCGAKADLAFNKFSSAFAYGLGMENESDYPARPEHEKQKLKAYAMELLTKSRKNLDQERQLLRKKVEGN